MNRDQKKNYIEKMATDIDKSQAVIVTHYQGLNMPQLDQLRKQMREHGILFKITKNRITKIALEKTRAKELSKLFAGPTAVALSDDAITSAKILTKIHGIKEFNIGHFLIGESIFVGLKKTIKEFKKIIKK